SDRARTSVGAWRDLWGDDGAGRHWSYSAVFASRFPCGSVGCWCRRGGGAGRDHVDSSALYGYTVVFGRDAGRTGWSTGVSGRSADRQVRVNLLLEPES